MVSVEKWKEHFKRLTSRLHSPDDVYLVNQTGRGLGRNAYPKKVLYKVRSNAPSSPAKVEIVSPVAQNVNQARALIKGGGIKKTHKGKGSISKKGRGKGKKSKPNKKKKKKTTKKSNKKKKKSKKK